MMIPASYFRHTFLRAGKQFRDLLWPDITKGKHLRLNADTSLISMLFITALAAQSSAGHTTDLI